MKRDEQTERRLKIQPKYVPRQVKEIMIPEIRICGKWLHQIGFSAGRSVKIQHLNDQLIITIIAEEAPEQPK